MTTAITFSRQHNADLSLRKCRTESFSSLNLKVSIFRVHEMTNTLKVCVDVIIYKIVKTFDCTGPLNA